MRGTKRRREMRKALSRLAPLVSLSDAEEILSVGLASHLRHLPVSIALWQALTSRARHAHTDYDALLAEGYDHESARHFCIDEMNAVLTSWGCSRQIDEDES